MRQIVFIVLLINIIAAGCKYENEEDLYNIDETGDTVKSGLIAYYPFNGNSNDESNNGNDASLHGNPEFTTGIENTPETGLMLDGKDDFLTALIGEHDSVSVSLWFKGDGSITSPYAPALMDYGIGAMSAYLDAVSGGTYIVTSLEKQEHISESWINSFENWCFLYIEFDGNTSKIYYIGNLNSGPGLEVNENYTTDVAIEPSLDILYIGRLSVSENIKYSYFKGKIDEVKIFNRFLTSSEILSLKNVNYSGR